MLRIKMWRLENVVLMKVLEQDKTIRGKGCLLTKHNFSLVSMYSPYISRDHLFIQGKLKEEDNRVVSYAFSSIEEAIDYIKDAKEVVADYNKYCSNKSVTENDNDIETFILE